MNTGEIRSDDLSHRFQRVVREFPERVAVRAVDEVLSYAELDRRSRSLTGALAAAGIGPGARVGIHLERTTALVVALVAVWRTGAAYVPLDPAYPEERIAFMAADTGMEVVVVDGNDPCLDGVETVRVDGGASSTDVADVLRDPVDAAYVIYTSGTTGKPKGVQVSVGNVEQLVRALEDKGVYGPGPRTVAWNASASFDASVQQWVRVLRGDTLVLLSDDQRTEADTVVTLLDELAVTDIDFTPTHVFALREQLDDLADRVVAAGRPALRLLIGGEAIPDGLWSALAARSRSGGVEAVNLYGPTECGVDATAAWIDGPTAHIGSPLRGVGALVLDEELRPVPSGTAGQLHLSGAGVADGYLNQPALTAQRFVANPLANDGSRMYRTGDRVLERVDGTFEFLGRADRQVKLRGFRIELDEIGSVLEEHPSVDSAAVVVSGGRELVAFVTGPARDTDELRSWCESRLPRHMLPGTITRLDRMPITAGGKVDHLELENQCGTRGSASATDGARDTAEGLLRSVWAEVLGQEHIDVDDNFFALGGHSLLAITVVGQVRKTFAVKIKTADVYRFPRLGDLASHIEESVTNAALVPVSR